MLHQNIGKCTARPVLFKDNLHNYYDSFFVLKIIFPETCCNSYGFLILAFNRKKMKGVHLVFTS